MTAAPALLDASEAQRAYLVLMARDNRVLFGTVRRRSSGRGWRIDARPHGWIHGLSGVGFRSKRQAEDLLHIIRIRIAGGLHAEEACAPYLRASSPTNQIVARYAKWLGVKEAQVAAGELSPRTVQEYRRYAREGGELQWWAGRSIHEADEAALEDWSLWLAERGLGGRSRRHVLATFRTFLGWLKRRRLIRAIPEFPHVPVAEHDPVILSPAAQMAILEAISARERGAHLVAALMGLRSGEVRALAVPDYRRGQGDEPALLSVTKAMQSLSWRGEPGPTKSRRNRRLPCPAAVSEWIEEHTDFAGRLSGAPLFTNPRTRRRWSHWALRQSWLRGCKAAGLPPIPLYEGTKHSGATAMLAATHDIEAVREYLGHADARSTRLYAKLTSRALVEIARRKP